MPKARKINDSNREQIAEDLKTMTRSAVCQKYGLDFHMIRREFGNAWTHGPQSTNQEAAVGNP